MKKKILMACLCVALAVLTIAGTTLAYLTSTAKVENTFTVGNVSIKLDEAAVNPDGTLKYKEDGITPVDRVDNNSYKLMPGQRYVKDPIVHVDAISENCWIFVKVDNGIADFEAATSTEEGGYKTIADQIAANGWTAIADGSNVYYKEYTKGQKSNVVFENFQIADDANSKNTWKDFTGSVTVNAYAVQKDGFGTALEAWNKNFATTSGN